MSTPKGSWALDAEREEQLPEGYETKPDERGIKTVVEFKWKDGRRVKVTKRIRVTEKVIRRNRTLEARRALKKFGNAADALSGPEPGFTGCEDNIRFELTDTYKKLTGKIVPDDALVTLIKSTVSSVTKTMGIAPSQPTGAGPVGSAPGASAPALSSAASEVETKPGIYVPPSKRRDAAGGSSVGGSTTSGSDFRSDRPEGCTVRVSNLSPDVEEEDLRFYFGRCGPLHRVFLARDRETQISKGYAFITFQVKEDAETAVQRMNGFGLSHLIIQVEWARD